MLQLAIFASSLAFLFFTMTVEKIGVSKANVFSNLIPVFTAVFSFFIIGETFSVQKIAGIFIVIFGVFLSQLKKKDISNYQSIN
jgi:drug/metabolite transporter (DMT)-like permease